MADVKSKQSLDNDKTLSDLVWTLMEERNWSAAQLARESYLDKSTIGRILNSNNGKKHYQTTHKTIVALAATFQIGKAGYEKLLLAANPELAICFEGLEKGLTVAQINDALYDAGKSLLEHAKTE